jgi:hypothetical protein
VFAPKRNLRNVSLCSKVYPANGCVG